MASFESSARDWREWYRSAEPETAAARLPGEWENRCSELMRLIIVRCLRPDRIVFAVTAFIVNNLTAKFTEPPVLDLGSVLADSMATTPLIFVLSPGVDPTNQLLQLSEQKGVPFNTIALGQGQAPHAVKLVDQGTKEGHWVLLANCHLMMSWLGELDKIIETLPARNPHASFRLWLSSSPHPQFPIGILQRGIKMTTEPPKGLKANLGRSYIDLDVSELEGCAAVAQGAGLGPEAKAATGRDDVVPAICGGASAGLAVGLRQKTFGHMMALTVGFATLTGVLHVAHGSFVQDPDAQHKRLYGVRTEVAPVPEGAPRPQSS